MKPSIPQSRALTNRQRAKLHARSCKVGSNKLLQGHGDHPDRSFFFFWLIQGMMQCVCSIQQHSLSATQPERQQQALAATWTFEHVIKHCWSLHVHQHSDMSICHDTQHRQEVVIGGSFCCLCGKIRYQCCWHSLGTAPCHKAFGKYAMFQDHEVQCACRCKAGSAIIRNTG